jgi:hypothetical protein
MGQPKRPRPSQYEGCKTENTTEIGYPGIIVHVMQRPDRGNFKMGNTSRTPAQLMDDIWKAMGFAKGLPSGLSSHALCVSCLPRAHSFCMGKQAHLVATGSHARPHASLLLYRTTSTS